MINYRIYVKLDMEYLPNKKVFVLEDKYSNAYVSANYISETSIDYKSKLYRRTGDWE